MQCLVFPERDLDQIRQGDEERVGNSIKDVYPIYHKDSRVLVLARNAFEKTPSTLDSLDQLPGL